MSTSADFTLNGTPQADGVYRATKGGTVTLALVDGLLIDAGVVKVTLERKTKGATDIPELASEYVLSPATAELDLSIPDEISSWLIRVQLNNGSSTRGVEPTWTRERVIETVGDTGVAKQLAAERTERHPARGWSDIQNDMVDAIELIASGGGPTPDPDPFEGLDVSTELRADRGVEAGQRVARWADQRGHGHLVTFERDLMLWYEANTIEAIVADPVATSIRLGVVFGRAFDGDGDALWWPTGDTQPGALWSRTPWVYDGAALSIALRVRMSAANAQTILTQVPSFPNGIVDAPKLSLSWAYTSGGSGTLSFRLADVNETDQVATQAMTHSAWHNVIIRHDGSNMRVRVDGVNGTNAATGVFDDMKFDAAVLGCDINAGDGTTPGQMSNTSAIRHIIAAPRAWSDAECLTAEAALTAAWT